MKCLTNDLFDAEMPSWSPDGKKIVYADDRNIVDGSVNWEIYVMNADGTDQINLTNSPRATGDFEPSWSPDGSKITFASYRDGNWEIYVMNADGTNQTRLTYSPGNDLVPDFGPAPSGDSTTSNEGLFMVPESPIGALALMLSSLAVLATFAVVRFTRK